MINISNFTVEETELAALYMPKENRLQLIKAIVADKSNMDDSIRSVAENTVNKLAKMSDTEFLAISFMPAL